MSDDADHQFLLANLEAAIGPRGVAPDMESLSGRSSVRSVRSARSEHGQHQQKQKVSVVLVVRIDITAVQVVVPASTAEQAVRVGLVAKAIEVTKAPGQR